MEHEASLRMLSLHEKELVMMVDASDLIEDDAHVRYQTLHFQFIHSLKNRKPARLFQDSMILEYCQYFRTLLDTKSRETMFFTYFNNISKLHL